MSRIAVIITWSFAATAIAAAIAGPGVFVTPGETAPPAAPPPAAGGSKPQPPFVPAATETAVVEILGRSPFDVDRRGFTRDLPEPPPPPAPPPRLLGISLQGGKRVALLEWPATGQTQRVAQGDDTEMGKVKAIDAVGITIAAKDGDVTVSLFP